MNLFKHHENAQAGQQKDATLTTILPTAAQRAELTLLLHACTSSMRSIITDTFDPRYTGHPSDHHLNNPLQHDNESNLGHVDVAELDKQRKEAENRIKELSREDLQSLKRGALKFFDSWRESVFGRIGQVLNDKDAPAASSGADDGGLNKVDENAQAPTSSDQKLGESDVKVENVKEDERDVSEVNKAIKSIYRPVQTPLMDLDIEKRKLILHCTMLLMLSLEHYAAHSRVLLLYLASSLDIPVEWLAEDEGAIARGLLKAAEGMNADKETDKKAKENASSRKWKVGLAGVAGAAVIGITGGLAAPLVAAGLGTVMGGLGLAETATAVYLGSVASSSIVVGGLFGAYGGKMTGRMMDEYAKEVEDFGFLPIHKWAKPRKIEKEYRRLRVAIGISGWLTDKEDVIKPWRILSSSIEGFALKYEMETLLRLGNAMSELLKSTAWAYAKKEIIRRTIFAALTEALWPLAVLRVAKVVDNPFSVGKVRSDKAGEVLADALINRVQGERPVSLVGYSLGARTIYTCLLKLAERNAFGLVENVVLLGCPATSDSADWRKMRSVVCGRLVNVYSENDYILAFLYRATSAQYGVAGISKCDFVKGVENVDVSDVVSGHLRYRYLTGAILKRIGFEDIDMEEVSHEEQELAEMEELEERERKEHEKKYSKDGKPSEEEAEDMEKEVEKKNNASMMDWATAKLSLGSEKAMEFWGSLGAKKPEGQTAHAGHL